MLMQMYAYAARTHKRGICMVAVTNAGRQLGTNLGMKSHAFREDGAARWLVHYPSHTQAREGLRTGLSLAATRLDWDWSLQ